VPFQKPLMTLLEGKWFTDKDVSVTELFGPLFTVWTPKGRRSHHYEMFTNAHAFQAAIKFAMQKGAAHTIYIAAHGDADGLQGFHDEGISRTVIRNSLNQKGTKKHGVYFGSCLFCTETNALYILDKCGRIQWIAGYTTEVDWIDSSALDLVFLRHFLFPSPGRGTAKPTTENERLRYAVNRIRQDMGSLASRLEFHVYVRSQGKGVPVDLMLDAG
jgi:hypothetical protein